MDDHSTIGTGTIQIVQRGNLQGYGLDVYHFPYNITSKYPSDGEYLHDLVVSNALLGS